MWKRFVLAVNNVNNTVKVVFWIVALLGSLTGAYSTSKAIMAVPVALAKHDSVTRVGNQVLERMLCINVADHRKLDWNLCYVNPNEVMPNVAH